MASIGHPNVFSRFKCEKIDFNFEVTKRYETFTKIELMFAVAKYIIFHVK